MQAAFPLLRAGTDQPSPQLCPPLVCARSSCPCAIPKLLRHRYWKSLLMETNSRLWEVLHPMLLNFKVQELESEYEAKLHSLWTKYDPWIWSVVIFYTVKLFIPRLQLEMPVEVWLVIVHVTKMALFLALNVFRPCVYRRFRRSIMITERLQEVLHLLAFPMFAAIGFSPYSCFFVRACLSMTVLTGSWMRPFKFRLNFRDHLLMQILICLSLFLFMAAPGGGCAIVCKQTGDINCHHVLDVVTSGSRVISNIVPFFMLPEFGSVMTNWQLCAFFMLFVCTLFSFWVTLVLYILEIKDRIDFLRSKGMQHVPRLDLHQHWWRFDYLTLASYGTCVFVVLLQFTIFTLLKDEQQR